jgi:hypothetical protein
MSTEANPSQASPSTQQFLRAILAKLDELTIASRIESTLGELQVCIERINFHMSVHPNDTTISSDSLSVLLQSDVSAQMHEFVQWSIDQGYLKIFIGKVGRVFLSYCVRYYKTVPEVIVQTPIPLSDATIRYLSQQLRPVHPYPSRLVFVTNKSLIAGCVITTPIKTYNYSLSHEMSADIKRYTKARMRRPVRSVHG